VFARTERLLLRPGWAEDAPALAQAIADEQIVRNLSVAPWPYGIKEAEAFLGAPKDPCLPTFLLFARTNGAPELVGACGLARRPSGAVELGYWIARAHWNKGYATEAGNASLALAFKKFSIERVLGRAMHENSASIKVLQKCGMTYFKEQECGSHPGVVYKIDRVEFC
jgi:RimJ/RimL family protein N-acetyltransferase